MHKYRSAAFAIVLVACGANATHVVATHEVKPVPEVPLEGGTCAHVEIAAPDETFSSAYVVENGPDGDLCAVSTTNLAKSEAAALTAVRASGASPAFTAWGHKTKPAPLDRVQAPLPLPTA